MGVWGWGWRGEVCKETTAWKGREGKDGRGVGWLGTARQVLGVWITEGLLRTGGDAGSCGQGVEEEGWVGARSGLDTTCL